jgi:hypothetical protein
VSKRFSIARPTVQTPYHIDFDWWSQNDRNWRVYLRSYLTDEDQKHVDGVDEQMVDLVDQETAEVHRVDALQHFLITRYASQDDFITTNTSVSEAIFRLFLANGNVPMNATEIGEKIGRTPVTILRMLSGRRVYRGIRPYTQS